MNDIALLVASAVLMWSVVFWALRIRDAVQNYCRVPVMDPAETVTLPDSAPLISVIVPAHNEQGLIRECLESVLAQDYPCFELILVDDRSVDRTAAIARALSKGWDKFKIISLKERREGWTGKCNALDVGVRHAKGSWLAFLDADSRLHPSALRQCYRAAVASSASMVTLSPRFVLKGFWEKALQPVFAGMSCILYPLYKVNDPTSPVASANGMFYLIHRGAYDKIGGHQDVRDLAVEDIGIGKRVKAAGLGLLFANGRDVLQTRMYTGLSDILMGWTRILSASMNYEVGTVLKHLAAHFLISLPVVALALCVYVPLAWKAWPHTWFILPVVQLLEVAVVSHLYYLQVGVPRKYAGLLFIGNFMLVCVLALIVKKVLCRDALQWRGTTYRANRYMPRNLDPIRTDPCNSAASLWSGQSYACTPQGRK
ncbi:MAG: glycosyltransferase [Thermodesulfobacteriota bacterium]